MSLKLNWKFDVEPTLKDLASGVTLACTRATDGQVYDVDGWSRMVQDNQPRFWGCTFNENIVPQSQTFGTGWTPLNTSVSENDIVAPDGTLTGDTLTGDGLGAPVRISYSLANTFGYLFMSCYFKYVDHQWIQILHSTDSTYYANFDVQNGTLGNAGSNIEDYGIEEADNGWYRCWMVVRDVTVAGNIMFYLTQNGTSGFGSSVANTDSVGLWGAQVANVAGNWSADNLLQRSEEFDNVAWSKQECSISANAAVNPVDGATTADALVVSTTADTFHKVNYATTTADFLTEHVWFSIFVKPVDYNYMFLQTFTGASTYSYFDLVNGVVGNVNHDDAYIAPYGPDGWYRIGIKTHKSSLVNCTFYVGVSSSLNSNVVSGTPAGTELNYIFGGQLERSKPNQEGPGAYLATTTAAAVTYDPPAYLVTVANPVSELTGKPDGLRIDWNRTNLCLQSENLGASWFAVAQGAHNVNTALAPDGTYTADQLIDDGLTGTGQAYYRQNITVATSTTYVYSHFLKADGLSWARLDYAQGGLTTATQYFDLENGALGTTGAQIDDSGIIDIGNGWYRCWIKFTSDAVDTTGAAQVIVCPSDGSITVDRDGTSSILVWGAQFEVADYPSSYMPTTTSTFTRNVDNIRKESIADILGRKGTVYVRAESLYPSANQSDVLAITGASPSGDRISFYKPGDGRSGFYISTGGGGAQSNISVPAASGAWAVPAGTFVNLVAAWEEGYANHYMDGAASSAIGTPANIPVVSRIVIGALDTQEVFTGLIQEVAFSDEVANVQTMYDLSRQGTTVDNGLDTERIVQRKRQRDRFRRRYRRT